MFHRRDPEFSRLVHRRTELVAVIAEFRRMRDDAGQLAAELERFARRATDGSAAKMMRLDAICAREACVRALEFLERTPDCSTVSSGNPAVPRIVVPRPLDRRKPDPVVLDTVSTTMTATKEAVHAREAKVGIS
jgi:hypothetical protein